MTSRGGEGPTERDHAGTFAFGWDPETSLFKVAVSRESFAFFSVDPTHLGPR